MKNINLIPKFLEEEFRKIETKYNKFKNLCELFKKFNLHLYLDQQGHQGLLLKLDLSYL